MCSTIFILVITGGKRSEFESELVEAGTADAPATMTWVLRTAVLLTSLSQQQKCSHV